ncbi:hypothetical protein WAI453_010619 [Rhynchosporium graminicola]
MLDLELPPLFCQSTTTTTTTIRPVFLGLTGASLSDRPDGSDFSPYSPRYSTESTRNQVLAGLSGVVWASQLETIKCRQRPTPESSKKAGSIGPYQPDFQRHPRRSLWPLMPRALPQHAPSRPPEWERQRPQPICVCRERDRPQLAVLG